MCWKEQCLHLRLDELSIMKANLNMSLCPMNINSVKEKVERAIGKFNSLDKYLLDVDASERSIAAKLASYLQSYIPVFSVDVEFNRDGFIPKRLNLPAECVDSVGHNGDVLVIPDIIVHERGSEGRNILCIEIKKKNDPRGLDCDRKRLEALIATQGYQYGALIECKTGTNDHNFCSVVEWIV